MNDKTAAAAATPAAAKPALAVSPLAPKSVPALKPIAGLSMRPLSSEWGCA